MNKLPPLNLPPYPFNITDDEGQLYIFDDLRKKNLLLTPEEWVRQHFVQFLIHQKNFPKGLIKLEGGLKVNTRQRRTDILVFNNAGQKVLLVECKAPQVKLNQLVFDQIARYNFTHRVPYLAVSNGLQHYYCKIDFDLNTYSFIPDIYAYGNC
jgi:hypothetical protein